MCVSEITDLEVHTTIGWDELPASIFKTTADLYNGTLTHIINKSITDGAFPDELKMAKIIHTNQATNQ